MDEARPGRTPSLSPSQLQALEGVLRKPPVPWVCRALGRHDPVAVSAAAMGHLPWGSGSVSGCFASWDSGYGSPGRRWPMPIPLGRRHIKKLRALARDHRWISGPSMRSGSSSTASACRMWVAPEIKDPVLLHHPTREGIGYFGAVRIRTEFVYSREVKRFNAETFFAFLKKLRRLSSHAGRRVVRFWTTSDTIMPACIGIGGECGNTIIMEFMPPYSPELNPVERVWKLTRRKATHNQYFDSMRISVPVAVENVFDEWRTGNGTRKRLCALFNVSLCLIVPQPVIVF